MPAPASVRELATLKIFAGVDEGVLEPVASATFAKRLARGQLLFTAGEPSEHLFVIRTGAIKVFLDSDRGDELVLTILEVGDLLGELSAIDGLPRSATAQALRPTEVLAIPVARVREVLTASPAALFAVAVELAENLRRLSGSTADLVFLDEPTTALDATAEHEVLQLTEQLRAKRGAAVVMVTHLVEDGLERADRALLLDRDHGVARAATAAEVRALPEFARVYGRFIARGGEASP